MDLHLKKKKNICKVFMFHFLPRRFCQLEGCYQRGRGEENFNKRQHCTGNCLSSTKFFFTCEIHFCVYWALYFWLCVHSLCYFAGDISHSAAYAHAKSFGTWKKYIFFHTVWTKRCFHIDMRFTCKQAQNISIRHTLLPFQPPTQWCPIMYNAA